jgi:hypothetical protein
MRRRVVQIKPYRHRFGRRQMRKTESIVIGLLLGIAIPFLTFVVFWWTTALIHLSIPSIPIEVVIAAAFTGLVVGVVLDLAYLKRWIKGFYTANPRVLATLYLGLCIVAVALFMGLPVGTLILGVGAGIYVGRRRRIALAGNTTSALSIRHTAFFAASVTALAALPIGLLALDDRSVIGLLETRLFFGHVQIGSMTGPALIASLCCILFAIQYGCTLAAGKLSYRLHA